MIQIAARSKNWIAIFMFGTLLFMLGMFVQVFGGREVSFPFMALSGFLLAAVGNVGYLMAAGREISRSMKR